MPVPRFVEQPVEKAPWEQGFAAVFEAVVGAEVAARFGYQPGEHIVLSHGSGAEGGGVLVSDFVGQSFLAGRASNFQSSLAFF